MSQEEERGRGGGVRRDTEISPSETMHTFELRRKHIRHIQGLTDSSDFMFSVTPGNKHSPLPPEKK